MTIEERKQLLTDTAKGLVAAGFAGVFIFTETADGDDADMDVIIHGTWSGAGLEYVAQKAMFTALVGTDNASDN